MGCDNRTARKVRSTLMADLRANHLLLSFRKYPGGVLQRRTGAAPPLIALGLASGLDDKNADRDDCDTNRIGQGQLFTQ